MRFIRFLLKSKNKFFTCIIRFFFSMKFLFLLDILYLSTIKLNIYTVLFTNVREVEIDLGENTRKRNTPFKLKTDI